MEKNRAVENPVQRHAGRYGSREIQRKSLKKIRNAKEDKSRQVGRKVDKPADLLSEE